MTNLLVALKNIAENPVVDLDNLYNSSNRANAMGDTLEFYIKDLFCNSLSVKDVNQKNIIYERTFSYMGNQNNPPDAMIRGGDAIEIKKIESLRSGVALNSSYPKDKIYSDSSMITKACRDCESWKEKDLIYIVGVVKESKLKSIWFVYGSCYAAEKDTYERIKNKISKGLDELDGIELSDTNELGRVNKVDPLGITYLRIRGMWHIENPVDVFDYISEVDEENELTVNALILDEKYQSFPESDRVNLEKLVNLGLFVKDVKIKSPNNPAQLLNAKLIQFVK
ncbi:MAG: NgoPII family restriction endonuclease [Candidatus Paceibacterota bacterium]|jgi:hypothetical protein